MWEEHFFDSDGVDEDVRIIVKLLHVMLHVPQAFRGGLVAVER